MGMSCVWEQERGFGERSWRYSMVVDSKTIEKVFVEGNDSITQDSGPDPFEVSDADTMLTISRSNQPRKQRKRSRGGVVVVNEQNGKQREIERTSFVSGER
mmetsp:Transcript_18070/g.26824  ORF Transcript_18070/g.26824 Transcript_18070/m.26824 type:complete len:101 (-) Transcript_18070:97-399(-)